MSDGIQEEPAKLQADLVSLLVDHRLDAWREGERCQCMSTND